MRALIIASAAIAAALMSTTALAKPKPAATALTQNDLRVCMGVDGSKPEDQIPVCTKIINSGKVKAPHTGDYFATRGAAYFAIGDQKNAKADLDKALTFRQASEFYFQRGAINLALFEWDAAKADYDKVIKLKPTFAPGHFMRGLVSYKTADYAEALSFFDAAVNRVPTYSQALFARGATKIILSDTSGGKKDLSKARELNSKVDKELEAIGVTPRKD
ncbi:MAG: hypothetical protein JNK07_09375 [Alphaproteobacteria bacterium]|nr:hypothetical protein [Alphaproteobacteria bacterium]